MENYDPKIDRDVKDPEIIAPLDEDIVLQLGHLVALTGGKNMEEVIELLQMQIP